MVKMNKDVGTSCVDMYAVVRLVAEGCTRPLHCAWCAVRHHSAFSVAGPVVWNSIPAAVRDADTVSSFKRKLKTHFFSMCFDDV